jgi:hypothetical protein
MKILGAILIIIGSVLLAYSVKTRHKFTGDKRMEDAVKRSEKDGFFLPNTTYTKKSWFYGGIVCITVGTIIQLFSD